MTKIREILNKYSQNDEYSLVIYENQFDKLEKELEEYFSKKKPKNDDHIEEIEQEREQWNEIKSQEYMKECVDE